MGRKATIPMTRREKQIERHELMFDYTNAQVDYRYRYQAHAGSTALITASVIITVILFFTAQPEDCWARLLFGCILILIASIAKLIVRVLVPTYNDY